MRRLLVFVVIALAAVGSTGALATTTVEPIDPNDAAATPTTLTPATLLDNSFLDTERDLTECLNNSVELPGCGRTPTQEGDRGGALQLAAFGVLTLGIAFICWRVTKGVRARDAALAAKIRP